MRDRLGFTASDPVLHPREVVAAGVRVLLGDLGQQSVEIARRGMSFRDWSSLVPEARGPLDFGRFAYQRELYEEWMVSDREACFLKATQTGVSTLAIRFALFHADVYGG